MNHNPEPQSISEIELADAGVVPRDESTTPPSSSQMSLPAALCDELLLKELQNIPNQMGFKIGDVADLLGVKQYILRYWESEFELLRPRKANNNQRLYTRKDVENAFLIRKLLHRDRFSIEGARGALRDLKQFVKKEKNWQQINQRLEVLHHNLHDQAKSLVVEIHALKEMFR